MAKRPVRFRPRLDDPNNGYLHGEYGLATASERLSAPLLAAE